MTNAIVIKNPSSPGASFTDHTDTTILACWDFLRETRVEKFIFTDFQAKLLSAKKINKSNLRCILPLLRYAGLVSYDKYVIVNTFFTKLGKQYVEVTKLLKSVVEAGVPKQNEVGYKEALKLRAMFLRYSLVAIVKSSGCSYSNVLMQTFKYLQRFSSIDKTEFAYLAYGMQKGAGEPVDVASQFVAKHRAGVDVEISLSVRDDAEGVIRQKDTLSWLTSYNYILALLEQAGIVSAQNGKFTINSENANDFSRALSE